MVNTEPLGFKVLKCTERRDFAIDFRARISDSLILMNASTLKHSVQQNVFSLFIKLHTTLNSVKIDHRKGYTSIQGTELVSLRMT